MARCSKKYKENVSKEKLSNKSKKNGLQFNPDSEVNNSLPPLPLPLKKNSWPTKGYQRGEYIFSSINVSFKSQSSLPHPT